MGFILERNVDRHQLAAALHEAVLMPVDQNVGDGRVLEQWLKRAKANHFINNVVNQCIQFGNIQRKALFPNLLGDISEDFAAHILNRHALQSGKIEVLNQLAMKPTLASSTRSLARV